jgi:hypothetical protein
MLASSDGLAKDVPVMAVVIPKLELGDVEREILLADLVECSNHAALSERPETFNRLGVNGADNILAASVVNSLVWEILVEAPVTNPLIGAKQADLGGNGLTHELGKGRGADILDNPRNHIALAADGARDSGLARADAACSTPAAALIPMPVLGLAADEGFINLDGPYELPELFLAETRANAVAHIPSGSVRAEAHHAMDLKRADPLLAGEHEVDDAEPLAKRLIGVLENRPGDVGEAVIGPRGGTGIAQPVPGHRAVRLDLYVAAAGTGDAFGPAVPDQIGTARILIRERRFPLADGHLMDLLGLFGAGHDGFPLNRSHYGSRR